MEKLYYFSVAKHAHDIEFYRNRLFNTMRDMENGDIEWDETKYDEMSNLYYGDLDELYKMMFTSRDGVTVKLTGKQIGLAKEIVAWASNTRAQTCIDAGRYDLLQYC